MNKFLPLLFILGLSAQLNAQDFVYRTFKDTRVINTHSVETLQKRKLDIRIMHRFGDLFGESGGWETFYGLENATDVAIGGEYGVTDNLTVGLLRAKGAGPLRQLVNGLAKYRILRQTQGEGSPITITTLGVLTVSTMQKSENPEAINFFQTFEHRMAYTLQALIARQFSERFSLQLAPGYTHRNLVQFGDQNGIFSLGLATRIQVTKVIGLIADANLPMSGEQSVFSDNETYAPALGIGIEFDTGGHVFQVNLTNATGIMENDYIPYTTSEWSEGEFRLGFTISRLFNL